MVGQRIRYYRKTKGLTQEELAQGICSVSYLSKIEKGDAKSSEEVINLLCERLGISPEEVDNNEILELLNEWNLLMTSRKFDEAQELFPQVAAKITTVRDPDILIRYKLFCSRYYLILKNPDLENALDLLEEVKGFYSQLTPELKFYYYVFWGMHANYSNKYKEALEFLHSAEDQYKSTLNVNELDIAVLYYLLALTYNFQMRINSVTNYAYKAITIFDSEYNYSRSADCQVLLGISYRRAKNYEQAEFHLKKALKYSTSFKDDFLSGVIYHNLGYVNSCKNNNLQAIDCYKKSLLYKDSQPDSNKANTLFLLATEYFNLEDYDKALDLIEQGFEIVSTDSEIYYHLTILKLRINKSDKFENFLAKEVIPFFEKRNTWEYVSKYSELLADIYFDQGSYKKASQYYRIANNGRKNIF
ncbi:tetratricopeptide repeat protein [Fictibacillus barbaricus]|uniref:Tetratricopeptide repeat protein n=1 Tax=Fictibacillus barbaricus TaxID=182136 RepID=A0ABS2Z9T5_9BACL|nr:tetratricopeptide repeat protein [Fictibacillus barbaricus]MBN3543992.1 tetratricopeptide repeat protein [Fictibacillus barbaricus]GGB70233.1 transcriptional regulator [Fictibacillus barbaricus]